MVASPDFLWISKQNFTRAKAFLQILKILNCSSFLQIFLEGWWRRRISCYKSPQNYLNKEKLSYEINISRNLEQSDSFPLSYILNNCIRKKTLEDWTENKIYSIPLAHSRLAYTHRTSIHSFMGWQRLVLKVSAPFTSPSLEASDSSQKTRHHEVCSY